MNMPVSFGLSIIDLSKAAMYEFCYDYIKSKYGENTKLCYTDTGSFIVHVKTEDIYKDIAEDIQTRSDSSNYEIMIDHCLWKKNEKVTELMKDELGGQIVKKCVELKVKTYSYLKDNNDKDKKQKGQKVCHKKKT